MMGHFIPTSRIAEVLVEKGHDVIFITNNNEWENGKAKKILDSVKIPEEN